MKTSINREYLITLKQSEKMYRQGVSFRTDGNAYFYDTGTGNVVHLDAANAPIINALFDDRIDCLEFQDLLDDDETVDSIVNFLQKEHLLMRPDGAHFVDLNKYICEKGLECQQLIIELTGQCNLRCKYCVYNEQYEHNREFNEECIDFNTARKAIDYAYAHKSNKNFAIGFYGGEPLLNFKVMKECIDYCLNTYKEVSPVFAFTSNMTLMTKEIADYLARIPNMSVIVSLDGPKEIQNTNRTFANGAPTFDAVYRGIRILSEAIKENNSNCQLNINSVFMPPFTQERFEQINEFFESLTFLPENSGVTATYPAPGSIPNDFLSRENGQEETQGNEIEWVSWALDKVKQTGELPNSPNLYSSLMRRMLGDIHNRRVTKLPTDEHCWNACCIPGNRRLYVCTNGTYKLCEKMGESPCIGNVDTGVDFSAVKRYYLDQYEKASLPDCANCWAVNLCSVCYCSCYNETGVDIELKRKTCQYAKETALMWLSMYYEIYENNPSLIEQISRLERT